MPDFPKVSKLMVMVFPRITQELIQEEFLGNASQECIFQRLERSALKELSFYYDPNCKRRRELNLTESVFLVANPWFQLGKHLPETLRSFRFNGEVSLVENLVDYRQAGRLKEVTLRLAGSGLNEDALLDFIKSATKLSELHVECKEWIVSESFVKTLVAVNRPGTNHFFIGRNDNGSLEALGKIIPQAVDIVVTSLNEV